MSEKSRKDNKDSRDKPRVVFSGLRMSKVSKELLEKTINKVGSIENASKALGISRALAYRLAKRYGITGKTRRIEIDEKELVRMYKRGDSVEEIADYFYVSMQTIRRRLYELGYKQYEVRKVEIDKEKCIELLRKGYTNAQLSEHFDCSMDRIRNFIKNNGLKGYRKKKVPQEIVEAKIARLQKNGEKEIICKAQKISKVKHTCLYGGHCGGYDCCDYILLTGKMRNHDPENPERCFCYVHISEAEKRNLEAAKTRLGRDILIT